MHFRIHYTGESIGPGGSYSPSHWHYPRHPVLKCSATVVLSVPGAVVKVPPAMVSGGTSSVALREKTECVRCNVGTGAELTQPADFNCPMLNPLEPALGLRLLIV